VSWSVVDQSGLDSSTFGVQRHERSQAVIEPFDAAQVDLEELDRRDFAETDGLSLGRRVTPDPVAHAPDSL
jgi:hypothetical protein